MIYVAKYTINQSNLINENVSKKTKNTLKGVFFI